MNIYQLDLINYPRYNLRQKRSMCINHYNNTDKVCYCDKYKQSLKYYIKNILLSRLNIFYVIWFDLTYFKKFYNPIIYY